MKFEQNWLSGSEKRRSHLKMLTDGRTEGLTDDGRKVITITHPEQSSGELKSSDIFQKSFGSSKRHINK